MLNDAVINLYLWGEHTQRQLPTSLLPVSLHLCMTGFTLCSSREDYFCCTDISACCWRFVNISVRNFMEPFALETAAAAKVDSDISPRYFSALTADWYRKYLHFFISQKKYLRMISFAKRCDSSALLFRDYKLQSVFNVSRPVSSCRNMFAWFMARLLLSTISSVSHRSL